MFYTLFELSDMDKVAEPKWECLCRNHKEILCKCPRGRAMHKLLGVAKRIHYHKGVHSRCIRSLSTILTNFCTIWYRLDSLKPMGDLLGGSLKKKSMNTIPFNAKMRTLAYIMIRNLYSVTNLTTLSRPRTMFLYDFYTHKEIDICRHIYYLLTKNITKRNSRIIFLCF